MPIVQSVEIKKRGVSEKTGKSWTMYNVELDNGLAASGFDLVKVGETVEIEQKGDFLNYFKVKLIPGVPVNAPQSPVARPNGVNGLDTRQKAIIRQHSQSMAIEVLKLKQALNELGIDDLTPAKLRALADYFDQDVMKAATLIERDEPY